MSHSPRRLACACATALGCLAAAVATAAPEALYVNGRVYTGVSGAPVAQAFAVEGGRVRATGTDEAVRALAGPMTRVVDLGGRFAMAGLIDGHMHPLEGGQKLIKCSLDYARLTVADLQARIQKCLDATRGKEPDGWLEVVSWFREAMLPAGVPTDAGTLDVLKTKRPIIVVSSFGHTALVNSRALKLAKIDAHTPDPLGGRIDHDAHGEPDGILEDAAFDPVLALIPRPTREENLKAARAALAAMAAQGVTTFLDADATGDTVGPFAAVARAGGLTARGHFALHIAPEEGRDPAAAAARVHALAARFDQGPARPAPTIAVHNIKVFLDGVINAPAFTGAMLAPYLKNVGTADSPHWVPGDSSGPTVYFPPEVLKPLFLAVARVGLEPHMHADGDAAVRVALDAIGAMRQEFSEERVRAAIAHDESVDPADFPRYARVGAIPVLSFQWEKRDPPNVDNGEPYLGPERFRYMEPAGFLAAAGARIAFGSDWPVDPLNEWFALKVAVTRENDPAAGEKYRGRLGDDPGLTLEQALAAFTANAAYELHAERSVGTLEEGMFADFIVLDRDLFHVPPAELAGTRVLLTVVGGRTVHALAPFAPVPPPRP